MNVLESKGKERSLDEELGYSMGRNFKCKECDTKIASNETLRMHKRSVHGEKCEVIQIRFLLQGLENQILEQKLDLTNKISMMKETESNGRQTCKCIGWCAISHTKHSWKKSVSEEFHHKFKNLTREKHSCNICEAKFENVNQLDNHMQTHKVINQTDSEVISPNVQICEQCEEKFSNVEDFIFHMENSHKAADVMFLG